MSERSTVQFRIGQSDALSKSAYRGESYGTTGTFRRYDYDEGWSSGQAILKSIAKREAQQRC